MKKKVLIIGMSSILGGVETYIYNFVKYISRENYFFDFLIIGTKRSVFENEINKLLGDGINHFYYCPNLKYDYLSGKKWLHHFYKKHNYDYIYLNTCTAAKVQYCTIPVNKGSILISHSHSGDGNSKINNAFFRPYLKKKSKYKLACSDLAGKWLYGGQCFDFDIIPNGVDTSRFAFDERKRNELRKELNICNRDVLIGHVGRFSYEKNHEFFLSLAKILPNRFKFICIGNGELKEEFINKIKNNNLSDRFLILPVQNNIEAYYNAMDLFAMPSIYEGLPIVSVEAQANGLNCIFSDAVSKQADLSEHCFFISLNELEDWKNTIGKMPLERYDGKSKIQEKKFDIYSTVKKVEDIMR